MILVTGSSGTIGTEVLRELQARGAPVRAGYRSRKPSLQGVETARLDLSSGEGLPEALRGVEALFLLSGDMPNQAEVEIATVKAAKKTGVRRIVKLSVLNAAEEEFGFGRMHRAVEREIEASGIAYNLLRPNGFMQNFATYHGGTIRSDDAFYLPCGEASVAHVDARDIAAMAAVCLTGGAPEGKAYDLTGPQALTFYDVAEKLSAPIGRTINYVSIAESDYRAALAAAGVPDYYIELLVDLCRYYRTGKGARIAAAPKELGGGLIAFERFARDYAGSWK
jgi:uncharacterized protein YbjT (DUF2867 family)